MTLGLDGGPDDLELERSRVPGVESGADELAQLQVAVAGHDPTAGRRPFEGAVHRVGELEDGEARAGAPHRVLGIAFHPAVPHVGDHADPGTLGDVGAVAKGVHERHVGAQ